MSARFCLTVAAALAFVGVALGAFGAHGLKDSGFLEKKYSETESKNLAGLLVPASYKYLRDFETGVQYHLIHAIALLFTGVLLRTDGSVSLRTAAWCFLTGILLFSGSLYVLVIAGPKWSGIPWGMITPIGGTLLLIGWGSLAVACSSRGASGPV